MTVILKSACCLFLSAEEELINSWHLIVSGAALYCQDVAPYTPVLASETGRGFPKSLAYLFSSSAPWHLLTGDSSDHLHAKHTLYRKSYSFILTLLWPPPVECGPHLHWVWPTVVLIFSQDGTIPQWENTCLAFRRSHFNPQHLHFKVLTWMEMWKTVEMQRGAAGRWTGQ